MVQEAKEEKEVKVKEKKEKKKEKKEEIIKQWRGIDVKPLNPSFEILDRYVMREKFAEVIIASPPGRIVEPIYYVVETPLTPKEETALEKVKDILTKELDFPKIGEEEEVRKIIHDTTLRVIKKYKRAVGMPSLSDEVVEKFLYYIDRDLMGFGPLNVIMEDFKVEDISCDGLNIPIYVWHRDFESMPTNVSFTDREALDDFIIHLAHKAGKHVSSAFPIVDAMIYGKHRLAATFREEISPRGSTFTIRKFREKPFSVTELILSNVLNSEMGAYFWLLLENKASLMLIGATGSGKTTLLNALTTFIKPRMKIVTCEETAEINIPRDNWVRFVTRESYGLGATERGEVALFDLVKTSLRYRPDYLLVGEVRGEEAFVLFQAIATGHGGLTTVHAEDVESAIKRLMSPPMNIPETHISLLDAMALIQRVQLRGKTQLYGRRVRFIWEVEDAHKYRKIAEWDPVTDTFRVNFANSLQIENISLMNGISKEDLMLELWRRKELLEWMRENKITDNDKVASIILSYYADPEKLIAEAGITVRRPPIPAVATPRRLETVALPTALPSVVSSSPQPAAPTVSAEELEREVKPIADYIVEAILKRSGPTPYWQVFVKTPYPRDVIIRAMRYLKDKRRIDIIGGVVELME
ncbi:MAG: type II/IV secretion system ATPase subunit [Nitrososphaerota archaeon]|nr:type II/IV secretion system ATPase subunit [Candidatus Calditenuaceae archaeon]MDW8073879.1 type II/IV secretion system ATPase subunit [Nitrososphaerota archaeon]